MNGFDNRASAASTARQDTPGWAFPRHTPGSSECPRLVPPRRVCSLLPESQNVLMIVCRNFRTFSPSPSRPFECERHNGRDVITCKFTCQREISVRRARCKKRLGSAFGRLDTFVSGPKLFPSQTRSSGHLGD